MRIEIRGDDADGWFLVHLGPAETGHAPLDAGPYDTRSEAAHALEHHRRALERDRGQSRSTAASSTPEAS